MVISSNGIRLIKSFEGLRLKAYKDAAAIWTIGYGSTQYADKKPVKPTDELKSEEEASALLKDTLKTYEYAVNKAIKTQLNQNQFDALVSVTYNVGVGIMINSTLAKKLSAGNYQDAADQFLVWDKITDPITHRKIVCDTLAYRRKKERILFLTPYIDDAQKR